MNAEADLSARRTSAASPAAHSPAGASCCRNLAGRCRSGAGEASPSTVASKPLRRMKSSRECVMRDIWCSMDQGSSLELIESSDSHESFSLLKIAPPPTVLSGALAWCLDSTSIAAFKFSIAWMLSASPPWNSFCCFSRTAVASARAALSDANSSSSSLMCVWRFPFLAVRPSMVAFSSEILDSEVEMASPLSYWFLLHQQASLS
mmetsp:Transcript_182598/g.444544  ORF Transcript_182598/g.444544 Transcript_182598/m.444544 type:complete len:205 (-) Transcript_182598:328-942(-)